MFGRYTPDDVYRVEQWYRDNNGRHSDDTNANVWYRFYYPRRPPYPNIPSDEKINELNYIWHGNYTEVLWALLRLY